MSKHDTVSDKNSDAPIASTYNGNADGDSRPAVFAQHRTGRFESSTVFGEGAKADVAINGDELTLTLTVDGFDDPEQLLDRDILSVELTAKDLPGDL